MDGELLCLKWSDHYTTILRALTSVRKKEVYCDATVACGGRFYPVHKFVLASCSDYFEQMFEVGEQKNLMIVLTDIACKELEILLDYMYFGEVNVLQSDISTFMKAAERLRVKGLADPTEPSQKSEQGEKRNNSQKEDNGRAKRKRWSSEVSLHSNHSHNSIDVMSSSCSINHKGNSNGSRKEEHIVAQSSPSSDVIVATQLKPAPLGLEVSPLKETSLGPLLSSKSSDPPIPTSREPLAEALPSQIKLEEFNIKDEPEEWHDHSNVIASNEPNVVYLPTSASGLNAVDHGSSAQSQSGILSDPAQPLPGPSGLHSAPTWDHQGLSVSLPAEDFTQGHPLTSKAALSSRKTGRPTSDIWNHYKTERGKGKNVVCCIYCTTQRYGYPNATKMKLHTVKCKKSPENVRKHYEEELAQMVAKSEANKLQLLMKPHLLEMNPQSYP